MRAGFTKSPATPPRIAPIIAPKGPPTAAPMPAPAAAKVRVTTAFLAFETAGDDVSVVTAEGWGTAAESAVMRSALRGRAGCAPASACCLVKKVPVTVEPSIALAEMSDAFSSVFCDMDSAEVFAVVSRFSKPAGTAMAGTERSKAQIAAKNFVIKIKPYNKYTFNVIKEAAIPQRPKDLYLYINCITLQGSKGMSSTGAVRQPGRLKCHHSYFIG